EEQAAVPGANMKLIDYAAEPFAPKGVLCARFAVKFDDHRANFPAPGTLLVRGIGCVPPSQPQVVVTVRYAQRTASAEWSPALRAAADPVLDSLRFVSANEQALHQAREAVRGEKPGQAVELLTPSAQDGDAEAALFLGNIYLYGHGVAPDYQLARR